jgi:hypothetical protein
LERGKEHKTPLDGASGLKTHCIPPTHRRLHLKQLKFKVPKQFRFKTFTGNDFIEKEY